MVAVKPTLHIDGLEFSTLEGFFDHVSSRIGGFVLCWNNHEISKGRLGYEETARQLSKKLERCHPDNVASVENDLSTALRNEGPTVFDWLVEIVRVHCLGGEEEDGVELILQ